MNLADIKKSRQYLKDNMTEATLSYLEKTVENPRDKIFINQSQSRYSTYLENKSFGIIDTNELNAIRIEIYKFLDRKEKEDKIKQVVLFVGASPKGHEILDIQKELEVIQSSIQNHPYLRVEPLIDATIESFQKAANKYLPKIIHFACHGNQMGLFLIGEQGTSENGFLNYSKLKDFVIKRNRTLDCVILSACESKEVGLAIKDLIPMVIAMNQKVHDTASIKFAEGFYEKLQSESTDNLNFKNAFLAGKEKLALLNFEDAFTVEKFESDTYN